MTQRRDLSGLLFALLASGLLLGCHALFGGSPWGDERSAGETAIASEDADACGVCHAGAADAHAAGPHGRKEIACGQCHRGGGHPDFDEPLGDGTCGGCHLAEYQQTARSAHATSAIAIDPARDETDLRDAGFRVEVDGGARFAVLAGGAAHGRLCAGCHYDQHRLSATRSRDAGFCADCHADRDGHYPETVTSLAGDNRCIGCHMRRGETVVGQPVTSHAFTATRERLDD